ncbi:hypothetical protein V6N11_041202 [Hibiscus sabdariffa]|uniref:Protein kinase domain-containing protein n=1 Tax=Hibiscus sabdariffa TaxID=183260 RepID=A0ABR2RJQ5_9ROSI
MLITGIKGTLGYLDPEYARGHTLTEKADVYAFDVLLFEELCAGKVLDTKLPEPEMNLARWAKNCIEDGTLYRAIDPYLIGKMAPRVFQGGRFWESDQSSKFGPSESSRNKTEAYEADTQGSVETVPCMTARISTSEFNYAFHLTPGQKLVRLFWLSTMILNSTSPRPFSLSELVLLLY